MILWDVRCDKCDCEVIDMAFTSVPDKLLHFGCGSEMRLFTKRRGIMQVSEAEAAVVFRGPDGKYSYPADNRKQTPSGHERIVMRSVRELEQHYRNTGALSEVAAYDRNSGGSLDRSEG